jgi:ABC-type nitrate/sulfonate/bicarbonate transport system substrate-binding protein
MAKKYKTPPKPIMDYTAEEIRLEMLEDYYERHPQEAERLLDSVRRRSSFVSANSEEMSEEYDKAIKKTYAKFFKRNTFDLSRFKDDRELTPEEEEEIIANLGRKVPSKKLPSLSQGLISEDEFEDEF